MLTGEYNAYGYTIFLNGDEVYSAGNSPYESSDIVSLDDGVSIDEIEKYCQTTIHDMMLELDESDGGIEFVAERG